MITLKNVGKEYRRGRWGLRDVSFHMKKGEFVILTGPSGAGKSTLMKLLSFEEKPTTGEVTLESFSSATIKKKQLPFLRRRLGLVFQDFRLLPDRTAFENVAFVLRAIGSTSNVNRRVMRALASVGLSGRGDAMPAELSGGEQQRIGIARAIVGDPFALLCDEPTGNLDEANKRDIFRLLKKVSASGTAVLIATHDMGVAKEFRSRTLVLDHGKLIADQLHASRGPAPASALSQHPMRSSAGVTT